METQLVIFLAFTAVTLTANTLVIWFAYRTFDKLTKKVTEGLREFQTNTDTLAWLRSLEAASVQAVSITSRAKEEIENFDPVLASAQNTYGFGLAKVDAKFEKMYDAVTEHLEKAHQAIIRPARKIGIVA